MASGTSGPWASGTAHTLAQFARRAGISEGRARALYAESPSGLPRPDNSDAGGRPLWLGATIDAWCASTGRPVSKSALWFHRAGPPSTPPVELARGPVKLPLRYGRSATFFHILWDTPRGHVIYLMPLDTGGESLDQVATAAAELIEPRWWSTALVLVPFAERFPFDEAIAYVYRLVEHTDQPDAQRADGPSARAAGTGQVGATTGQDAFQEGSLSGLRRWFARLADPSGAGTAGAGTAEVDTVGYPYDTDLAGRTRPAGATALWITHLSMEEIARPLGVRLPVWVKGTLTKQTITRSLAYDRTFTVPDATTGWPEVAARVQQGIDAGIPDRFPAGWAVLAVDAMQRLAAIRAAHEQVPDTGPGWYLVARPARPQVPLPLEERLAAAEPCPDMNQVAAELRELRALEADTDRDNLLGELYAELVELLHYQLERHLSAVKAGKDPQGRPIPGPRSQPDPALLAAYEDTLVRYFAHWSGPVIEVWAATLQPVEDPAAALRLRRVQRLLTPRTDDDLDPTDVEIYRDPAGRYVVVHPPRHDERLFTAEWPTSRAAVATWTERTTLVADNTAEATTLLALTPTPDGQMRVDPVPLPVDSHREAFAFGYDGGTPSTTCMAILRCALDPAIYDIVADSKIALVIGDPDTDEERPASQLWTEISTPRSGPLRLPWPQIQQWARDTRETVHNQLSSIVNARP